MSEIAGMIPLIEKLKMEGVTLIMVEHRLRELFRVADRVMALNSARRSPRENHRGHRTPEGKGGLSRE